MPPSFDPTSHWREIDSFLTSHIDLWPANPNQLSLEGEFRRRPSWDVAIRRLELTVTFWLLTLQNPTGSSLIFTRMFVSSLKRFPPSIPEASRSPGTERVDGRTHRACGRGPKINEPRQAGLLSTQTLTGEHFCSHSLHFIIQVGLPSPTMTGGGVSKVTFPLSRWPCCTDMTPLAGQLCKRPPLSALIAWEWNLQGFGVIEMLWKSVFSAVDTGGRQVCT